MGLSPDQKEGADTQPQSTRKCGCDGDQDLTIRAWQVHYNREEAHAGQRPKGEDSKSRNSDQADGLEGKDMVVVVEITTTPNILKPKDIIRQPTEMG